MFGIIDVIDVPLFRLLNGQLHHPLLDAVMKAVTTQENWYPVLLGLWVALLVWGGRRGRLAAAMIVVAIAFSDRLTCGVMKPLFGRLRPMNALPSDQVRLIVGGSKAFSFPSAHAANSTALAVVAAWRFPKMWPAFAAVAVLVAYSRVYVGVHYPFDVLVGALVGIFCGRAAIWIVRRVARWITGLRGRTPVGAAP